MASKIQLENALGNSITLQSDDAVAADEVIVLNKKMFPTAWARVSSDASILSGFNIGSSTNTATGLYSVLFDIPMDSENYSVVGISIDSPADRTIFIARNLNVNGFDLALEYDANKINSGFSFQVFGGKN